MSAEARTDPGSREVALLQGANRILEAALLAPSEEELGEICLEVAQETTGSAFGFIGLIDPDGTMGDIAISDPGWDACAMRDKSGHRRPPSEFPVRGLTGQVVASGLSMYTNDPANARGRQGTPEGHPPLTAFLGTPLRRAGEIVGIIALANRPGGYGGDDVLALEALAPAIAAAIFGKRATVQLDSERTVLEALMGHTPVQLAYLDASFHFVAVNSAYAAGSGHAVAELIGRDHFELFPNEESQEIFERVRDTKETVEFHAKPFEYADQPWRGVTYWDWRLSPILGEHDEVIGLVLSLLDVTSGERNRRFRDTVNRLNDMIHSLIGFDAMVSQVVPELLDVIGCDVAGVLMREGDGWKVLRAFGTPEGFEGMTFADSETGGLSRLVSGARPVTLEPIETVTPAFKVLDLTAVLLVPLTVYGREFGVLVFGHTGGPGHFGSEEVDFAGRVATSLSLALYNSELFADEQRHARLAEALTDIDNSLHSSMDPDEMARRAVADGAAALDADSGAVTLYREHAFHVRYAHGFAEDIVGTVLPEEVERHSLIALTTREMVVVEDSATDERVDHAHLARYGVAAVLAVPMVVTGEAIGCVYFNFATPRHFRKDEVDFARRLGASLSLAMENARLFETEHAAARVNEALNAIDASIHGTLDRDEMLRRVSEESAAAIGADGTVLSIIEGDRWVVRYAVGHGDELIGRAFTVEQAPYLADAIETQQPVAIADAFNDPRADRATAEAVGVRGLLMAPLISRDETFGGLFFDYADVHQFTEQDVVFASRLSASVSLALANIRAYEAEREIADRLQGALLSLPREVAGVAFAHRYRAASDAARVGGDFYDLFEIDSHRVGVSIGDIAGKGLDAAVLTSLIKNTIRAYCLESDRTPSRILEMTNDVVYASTPREVFVTTFLGVLDHREGTLTYSNAGHTVCALVTPQGPVSRLLPTGPLLGGFPSVSFGQDQRAIGAEQLLFLYTDGLTEARRGTEQYGEERLFEFLAAHAYYSVGELVPAVISDVLEYTGDRLSDDLAILALRPRPEVVENGLAKGTK